MVNGDRFNFSVPRNMIHGIPMYNDAVEWEIEHYKNDIIDRLKAHLLAQMAK
jgi:hypothetical protein